MITLGSTASSVLAYSDSATAQHVTTIEQTIARLFAEVLRLWCSKRREQFKRSWTLPHTRSTADRLTPRKLFLTPSTRSVARQPYSTHVTCICTVSLYSYITVTSFKIFRVVPAFLEIQSWKTHTRFTSAHTA